LKASIQNWWGKSRGPPSRTLLQSEKKTGGGIDSRWEIIRGLSTFPHISRRKKLWRVGGGGGGGGVGGGWGGGGGGVGGGGGGWGGGGVWVGWRVWWGGGWGGWLGAPIPLFREAWRVLQENLKKTRVNLNGGRPFQKMSKRSKTIPTGKIIGIEEFSCRERKSHQKGAVCG